MLGTVGVFGAGIQSYFCWLARAPFLPLAIFVVGAFDDSFDKVALSDKAASGMLEDLPTTLAAAFCVWPRSVHFSWLYGCRFRSWVRHQMVSSQTGQFATNSTFNNLEIAIRNWEWNKHFYFVLTIHDFYFVVENCTRVFTFETNHLQWMIKILEVAICYRQELVFY